CRPLQGERCMDSFEYIAHYGTVTGNFDRKIYILTAFDVDDFVYDLHVLPLAHVFVLIRVGGIDFFDIQILNVRIEIRHAPRDAVVVTDDDARDARKGIADDVEAASVRN